MRKEWCTATAPTWQVGPVAAAAYLAWLILPCPVQSQPFSPQALKPAEAALSPERVTHTHVAMLQTACTSA